jgi:hypothetical protein
LARAAGYQLAQARPLSQPFDRQRKQPFRARLLHQAHETFLAAEGQTLGPLVGKRRGESQVGRQAGAHRGRNHSAAHVSQKLTP